MKRQKNRIVKAILAIWLIAVFVCGNMFTDKAAGVEPETVAGQIFLGYLAGGAGFFLGCFVGAGIGAGIDEEGALFVGAGVGGLLASSGAVYAVGEDSDGGGSFGWTLLGGVASPVTGAIGGAIIGTISGDRSDRIVGGLLIGSLLAPIGETIAYQLTKKGDDPPSNIVLPMIQVRF